MTLRAYGWLSLMAALTAGCALNTPMPPAPVSSSPVSSQPERTPSTSKTTPTPTQTLGSDQYLVQKGDTLYSIGRKFGIPIAKLAEFNTLKAPYELQVGQVLNLKAKTGNPSADNTGNEEAEVVTSAITRPDAGSTPPVTSAATASPSKPESNGLEAITDSELRWQWPLAGKVTQGFDGQTNKGLNVAGNPSQVVNAASAGKVIYSGTDVRGIGRLIILKHNSNLLSVYAHQGNALVKEGVFVNTGDKLATLPATGNAQTLTLHFEIRLKGKPVDPLTYLPAK